MQNEIVLAADLRTVVQAIEAVATRHGWLPIHLEPPAAGSVQVRFWNNPMHIYGEDGRKYMTDYTMAPGGPHHRIVVEQDREIGLLLLESTPDGQTVARPSSSPHLTRKDAKQFADMRRALLLFLETEHGIREVPPPKKPPEAAKVAKPPRLPKKPAIVIRWKATWRLIKLDYTGQIKSLEALSMWLEKTHSLCKASPETLRDIACAGVAGLLDD